VAAAPVGLHSVKFDSILNDVAHPACRAVLVYCCVFDAFYCQRCDMWTEGAYSEPECTFCPGRPERPSAVHLPVVPADERG
jgi:hypothetical protein